MLYVRRTSPKWVLPVSVFQGEASVASFLSERLRSAGGSEPGSFNIIASALRLGVCDILCVPFRFSSVAQLSPTLSNPWTAAR